MKKVILTTLAVIFTVGICFAQDMITKKTGEDIKAKISEITTTQIKYYRFDNLNGPIYSIDKSEVLMIRYANGTKDIFTDSNKSTEKTTPNNDAQTVSTKTVSDSSLIKRTKTVPVDSISAKADTMSYALLYVYRPKNMMGFAIGYDLKISNDKFKELTIGRVKNNSKFVVKLYQEGITEIIAHTEAKTYVKINVKFGAKYYLKCGITTGVFIGRPDLILVNPEQGELDYTNLVSNKK